MSKILNKFNYLQVPKMVQIHNLFSSLGIRHASSDKITPNDECLAQLEEILEKLVSEDRNLHTYRRAIGFGENISEDLIPLLLNLKDDRKIATKVIDTTIKILVNLTIPIEYLLCLETVTGGSHTDVGRHTMFELNKLLVSCKDAFTDSKSTKAVMDHMKFIIEGDLHNDIAYCDSINNCLLLLRNVLHIPDSKNVQNQIIWNLFTQSIDKIIIYLISCPQKIHWGVTMVQLIAILYKDQHVGNLQKLLNLWLEASLSDSSEDNESNTSPPDQGSDDSSPIITSDSSDNGARDAMRKNTQNLMKNSNQNRSKSIMRGKSIETDNSTSSSGISSMVTQSSTESAPSDKIFLTSSGKKRDSPSSQSEDFGYATQVEHQGSISTSSNEDDQPMQKPIHQKPHTFQMIRYNPARNRTVTTTSVCEKKELRRKKLVKRSKTHTITMKGLTHHLPTDEDISNILKEFTVDFLLKGYGTLVHDLHALFLSNIHHVQIDTSHLFWLVTYFLKFATQLDLDLEHIGAVLSHDILSFLIFQGVWIYEELELSKKVAGIDLKPCLRRLHLVVTAIREFLQAVETYQKMVHLNEDDRATLTTLQDQLVATDDLRSLFLLLLRQYNPDVQSKQYLQDLILTNHNYLLFLDHAIKQRRSAVDMLEHLKQFATVEMMCQYGQLLEDFKKNGEFVNNCVFTMMHHIGGDIDHVQTLFQPAIVKTFSEIWETDYEISDDWSDLIEYIMNKFVNSRKSSNSTTDDDDDDHGNVEETVKVKIAPSEEKFNDGDVQVLKEFLIKNNKEKFVLWLQKILIETCYVKLFLTNPEAFQLDVILNEPIVYYFALLNLPIPLVPWTSEQSAILTYQPFVLLLHKLGFYLTVDTGKIFVTIPNFWNAEHALEIAQQLGPIDSANLKIDCDLIFKNVKKPPADDSSRTGTFSMNQIRRSSQIISPNSTQWFSTSTNTNNSCKDTHDALESTDELDLCPELLIPSTCLGTSSTQSNRLDDVSECDSISETASIASDLTRMYVSDEEDKIAVLVIDSNRNAHNRKSISRLFSSS